MQKQMLDERNAKAAAQEELFNKIKSELFQSLAENFRRVETELTTLKSSKAAYEQQIQSTLQGLSSATQQEQSAATHKVETLLQEQTRQLDSVRAGMAEDIGRIREQV